MLRYLIRLDNKGNYKPQEIGRISNRLGRVVERYAASLKNFRISEIAIEFDLFSKDIESKNSAVKALVSELGPLLSERDLAQEASRLSDKQKVVRLVTDLFNQQRYWECHESMEIIWRRERDSLEKDVQQGVILAASALVHAQKNENVVCLGMLTRSIEKLRRWKNKDYHGLDVEMLKRCIEEMLQTGRISFPKL